jgi:hypothetical protein
VFAAPSWLVLFWTGLAATLAAGAVVAPLAGPRGPRGALRFFRPDGAADLAILLADGLLL